MLLGVSSTLSGDRGDQNNLHDVTFQAALVHVLSTALILDSCCRSSGGKHGVKATVKPLEAWHTPGRSPTPNAQPLLSSHAGNTTEKCRPCIDFIKPGSLSVHFKKYCVKKCGIYMRHFCCKPNFDGYLESTFMTESQALLATFFFFF